MALAIQRLAAEQHRLHPRFFAAIAAVFRVEDEQVVRQVGAVQLRRALEQIQGALGMGRLSSAISASACRSTAT